MILWPTLKRLRFLESERLENFRQIASLLDERADLRKILADTLKENRAQRAELSRLRSEQEIEGLLREAAE